MILPGVESVLGIVSCVADERTEAGNTDTLGMAEVDIVILYFSYKYKIIMR